MKIEDYESVLNSLVTDETKDAISDVLTALKADLDERDIAQAEVKTKTQKIADMAREIMSTKSASVQVKADPDADLASLTGYAYIDAYEERHEHDTPMKTYDFLD